MSFQPLTSYLPTQDFALPDLQHGEAVFPLATWDMAQGFLEGNVQDLANAAERLGRRLVLVTLSSQPSFRAAVWQALKSRRVPVVSLPTRYRDQAETSAFRQAVERALEDQQKSFGSRPDLPRKSYRTQEEVRSDDLSSDEEQRLIDLLNAAVAPVQAGRP